MKKTLKKVLKIVFLSIISTMICSFQAFAMGWVDDGGGNWMYLDSDNTPLTATLKSSGDDKFYLDDKGYMVRDYLLEDYNGSMYYFDLNGKMVKNTWVAIDLNQVENQMDNPPSIYLYYFGSNGKAYRAKSKIVIKAIDGKKYLFNENGQMLSGWINEEGERFNEYETDTDPFIGYCYYAGDETDGVLREGWTPYEEGSVEDRYYLRPTLWFYFNTTSHKKVQSNSPTTFATKIINGNKFAFDNNGVMVEGWDSDTLDVNNVDNTVRSKQYFKEDGSEDVGRMTKREWVFAVPSKKQNLDDHDQEIERWFYSMSGGDIVKGVMKKINNKYYAFNSEGIMKSGLCVIDKATRKYIDTIDLEKTDGKDFIISRHYISTEKSSASKVYEIFDDQTQVLFYFDEGNGNEYDERDVNTESDETTLGMRRLGDQTVAFADDNYSFSSNAAGQFEGKKKNKIYQNGIRLKPESALGMGLVFQGYSDTEYAETIDHKPLYNNSVNSWARQDANHEGILSDYIVLKNKTEWETEGKYPVFAALTSSGLAITKENTVKKDKSNNYWLIGSNAHVINIYEVPIRRTRVNNSYVWQFKSERLDTKGSRVTTQWIDFGDPDEYGKTCRYSRKDPGEYALALDDTYCINFRFAD